jgi:hypothetical protein
MTTKDQQSYMPGEAAKKRGEIPTGEGRNKDYGKGRQSRFRRRRDQAGEETGSRTGDERA